MAPAAFGYDDAAQAFHRIFKPVVNNQVIIYPCAGQFFPGIVQANGDGGFILGPPATEPSFEFME